MTARVNILKIFELLLFQKDSQIVSMILRLFRKAVQVLTNPKFSSKEFVLGFKVINNNLIFCLNYLLIIF